MAAWREFVGRPWVQAVLLGLGGALLNFASRPPIYSVAIYLAGIGYFFVLFRHGWRPALLCAALASLPLLSTTAAYRPLLEVAVFAVLVGRLGWRLAPAVLVYWLLAAAPLAWWLAIRHVQIPLAVYWPGLLALGGNVALNLVLARQLERYSRGWLNPEGVSFHYLLSHWLVVFGLAPLLLLSIMVNHAYLSAHLGDIAEDVDHERNEAGERMSRHLDAQLQAIRIVASQMVVDGQADFARAQGLIEALRGQSPAIMSLWVLDREGVVRSAVSESFRPGRADGALGTNAADRAYFREARASLKPYVSDVFLGRGYATRKLVVALSVPVLSGGEFLGVVEASLDLSAFPPLVGSGSKPGLSALILDSRQHVVWADPVLGLAYDSPAPEALRILLQRPMPERDALLGQLRRQHYQLRLVRWQAVPSARWTLVMLYDMKPEIFRFNLRSLLTCFLALAMLLLIGRLAERRAAGLLAPLMQLHRRAESLDMGSLPTQVPLLVERGAGELMALVRAFNGMIARMAKSHLQLLEAMEETASLNRELEDKVAARTEELSRKARMLEELAITDALTGLRNRRYFNHELAQEWRRMLRYGGAFTVLMLDIDHFKAINDGHGHGTGDTVLTAVAESLRKGLRETDCVARWGGEEFAILLRGVDGEGARPFAERLRAGIEVLRIAVTGGELRCTVSIGLCDSLHPEAREPERLLALADAALYRAKNEGRNRVAAALSAASVSNG